MKSSEVLIGLAMLALCTQVAMAEGPAYEPPEPIVSKVSREDVKRATRAAAQAGTIVTGEASFERPSALSKSTLTATQVQAEAIEARRLGLIAEGEKPMREATPPELEQIRQAGLKALNLRLASQAP
jgi:hypothetical protein